MTLSPTPPDPAAAPGAPAGRHHDAVAPLLAPYAAELLDDPAEQRAVEWHAARCVDCHAELRSLLATTGALAYAPEREPMPTGVRDAVPDAVGAEPAGVEETTGADQHVPPLLQARRRPGAAGARRGGNAGRWRLPERAGPLVAGAACVLVLAGGVVGAAMQRSATDGSGPRGDGVRPATSDTMIGTSPVVELRTSGELAGATIELIDVHGEAVLVTKDLPPPPTDSTWRAWGVTADRDMHDMGEVRAGGTGSSMAVSPIGAMPREDEVRAIAITLEPAQPSEPGEPRGSVQAVGDLRDLRAA